MNRKSVLLVLTLSLSSFSATNTEPVNTRDGVGYVVAGTSTTVIGTSAFVLGGVLALFGSDMHGITQSVGTTLMVIGGGVDCVGLPLLVVGVNKRARVRAGLALRSRGDRVGVRVSLTM
ncbi:MAG: hypothetical protein GF331_04590 [Chitinivibrionales bacterium]|nr:hypothetical protein [Chitinivibrionales bacterium]